MNKTRDPNRHAKSVNAGREAIAPLIARCGERELSLFGVLQAVAVAAGEFMGRDSEGRRFLGIMVDNFQQDLAHGARRTVLKVFRLRYLGVRQRAELTAHPRVLIETDKGFWRADAAGYCEQLEAAEYTGREAFGLTKHCGREKQVRYHLLGPRP